MTKARSRLFVVGVLSALMLAISPMLVQAQSPRLIAKIPFGFHIRAEEFPAGEYTVSRLTNDYKVVHVSDAEGPPMESIALPATRTPEHNGRRSCTRDGGEE